MKTQLLSYLLLLLAMPSKAGLLIDSVRLININDAKQYGKLELGIISYILSPPAVNPYDNRTLDMYAVFTAPDGRKIRRDAFYYVPFWRCAECPDPTRVTTGDSCTNYHYVNEADETISEPYLKESDDPFRWRVRFAPPDTGFWQVQIFVRSVTGRDSSPVIAFRVLPSDHKGYIGVDRVKSPRYFSFKHTGEIFFPFGQNSTRERHIDTIYNRASLYLASSLLKGSLPYGGNLVRVFMEFTNFELYGRLNDPDPLYNYHFRQRSSFDLDSLFTLAENEGGYIQLVLGAQMYLQENGLWSRSPYNAANGGPISFPDSFFLNEGAKQAFRNRIRYVVARWGYSPHLFAYELLNETDLYHAGRFYGLKDSVRGWYRSMVRYAKALDSNHMHTVSAAFSGAGNYDIAGRPFFSLYGIPEIDFISEHHYGADYNIDFQRAYVNKRNLILHPDKPVVFQEFGLNWGPNWLGAMSFSNQQLHLSPDWHQGLWSTIMSGSGAPGFYWGNPAATAHRFAPCWGGQYAHFLPLRRFLEGDSIFYLQPLPVGNACKGRGPKDASWHFSLSDPGFDTVRNKCSCHPWNYTLDQPNPDFFPQGISTTNDRVIEVLALKASDRLTGWIRNKENYWYLLPKNAGGPDPALVREVLDNMPVQPEGITKLKDDSVTVYWVRPGSYQLRFYSTWPSVDIDPLRPGLEDGGEIRQFRTTVRADYNGILRFRIPTLQPLTPDGGPYAPDYGFKLRHTGY